MQRKGQWRPRPPTKHYKKALRQSNSVYDLPSTKEASKWMHAVCGYSVKSTWLKAIKAGNFIGWPLLTTENVRKYYPETDETPKGHMNQARKNVRSTKPKPTPMETCNTDRLRCNRSVTSTSRCTIQWKPCSQIKQGSSLNGLCRATSTSW